MDATRAYRERIRVNAHEVTYAFTILDDPGQERPFDETYRTECAELQTRWSFHMTNRQSTVTNIVSSEVTLRREDSTNREVGAIVCVSSFDNITRLSYKRFLRENIMPGEELKHFLPNLAMFPDAGNCVVRKADVVVRIAITGCHSEKHMDSLASWRAGKSNTFSSNIGQNSAF